MIMVVTYLVYQQIIGGESHVLELERSTTCAYRTFRSRILVSRWLALFQNRGKKNAGGVLWLLL